MYMMVYMCVCDDYFYVKFEWSGMEDLEIRIKG